MPCLARLSRAWRCRRLIDFRSFLKDKLETFSSAALLPLFFAFTGLRTQVSLLNDWQSWALCGVIILVAIAGKLGGSMLMSRWTGMSWSNSFAIGALMNTRGLVELVVLNIGYDLGILSGRIFAMMVLMALVTTFMTGPLLSLVRTEQRATQLMKLFEIVSFEKGDPTMARKTLITIAVTLALSILALASHQPSCACAPDTAFAADKPNFAGTWTMDRARSFGLPGNMNQVMTVVQKDDQIEVETKLIQPGNERVQKDTYILDGKEHDYTAPLPPNAPPNRHRKESGPQRGCRAVMASPSLT